MFQNKWTKQSTGLHLVAQQNIVNSFVTFFPGLPNNAAPMVQRQAAPYRNGNYRLSACPGQVKMVSDK